MTEVSKLEAHYKVSNWVNHVSIRNDRVGANYRTLTPGAVWNKNIAVNKGRKIGSKNSNSKLTSRHI